MDGNKIFQSFSSPPQKKAARKGSLFRYGDDCPLACGSTLPSPQTPLLGRGAAARRRLMSLAKRNLGGDGYYKVTVTVWRMSWELAAAEMT